MISENKFNNEYYLNACILGFNLDNQEEHIKSLFEEFIGGADNMWLEFSVYGERPWFETSKFSSRIYGSDSIKNNMKFITGNKCEIESIRVSK